LKIKTIADNPNFRVISYGFIFALYAGRLATGCGKGYNG
jgi:hypothetical protein